MRDPFRYFDSSPEVIRLVVMMYIRYPLSLRQVEDILFGGASTSARDVRFWWNQFGPMFAAAIRKRRLHHRSFSRWRWPCDRYSSGSIERRICWRAVDHEGRGAWGLRVERRMRGCAEIPEACDEALLADAINGDRPASVVSIGDEVIGDAAIRSAVGGSTMARKFPQPFRRRRRCKVQGRRPYRNLQPPTHQSTTTSTTTVTSTTAISSNRTVLPPGRVASSWRPERPQTNTLRRPALVCLTMPAGSLTVKP